MKLSKSQVKSVFGRFRSGRIAALIAVPLVALAVSGCGGGGGPEGKARASASGKVVFDGKPIPAGHVLFTHTDSGTMAICPISDGEYSSVSGEGPLVGANTVSVSALDKPDGQPLFGAGKAMQVTVEASGYTGDITLAADDVSAAPKVETDEEMQQAVQ